MQTNIFQIDKPQKIIVPNGLRKYNKNLKCKLRSQFDIVISILCLFSCLVCIFFMQIRIRKCRLTYLFTAVWPLCGINFLKRLSKAGLLLKVYCLLPVCGLFGLRELSDFQDKCQHALFLRDSRVQAAFIVGFLI